MKQSLLTNDSSYKAKVNSILNEDDIENLVVATRSEIHYAGKENIEGFAALVSMFIRSMLITSNESCLVNVDNVEDNLQKLKMEDGQLFYYATLEFKDSFTTLLDEKIKNLKTINVKMNF